MDYLTQAIFKLRPGSEFTFENDDYSTIKWHVIDGEIPSQKEIDAAIKEIKNDEIAAATNKENLKNAALEKLGLTADELQALFG